MRRGKLHPRRLWEKRGYGHVPVETVSESYQKFTRWLDRELESLVARWAHLAAPKRPRRDRARFRVAKPK
jgi:hypothetical protein